MRLAVLNPGGKDPEQHFPDFAGMPDDRVHAPINYHAYAACTGGAFYHLTAAVSPGQRQVLLLLRRDLKACLKALQALKQRGHVVAVSWKESGLHQVADQLNDAANLALFQEILSLADGALSSTPDLVTFYQASGARYVEFIPTPYPVDDPRWDFSVKPEERRGVFLGTREWDVPSRNHLLALRVALSLKQPLTVVNQDGGNGRKKLAALGGEVSILEGRRPYTDYLREVAKHRLVFQLDASAVPGQVAGDALLCRIPCVGGNSAVERLAFPTLCGGGRDFATAATSATRLLEDPAAGLAEAESAHRLAVEQLSFKVIALRLGKFFAQLGS